MNNPDNTPASIARTNYLFALDSVGGRDYPTKRAAVAAYLVNALDTARECRVSREETAAIYLDYVRGKRKP